MIAPLHHRVFRAALVLVVAVAIGLAVLVAVDNWDVLSSLPGRLRDLVSPW